MRCPTCFGVVANDDKPHLLQVVRRATLLSTAERFGDGDGGCGATIEPGVAGRTAFTLRVQTGCAEPCSYCIIPATRGAARAWPPAGVLAEVERVVAAGFKEIALTGVHLGSYGRDLTPRSSLIELLQSLTAALSRGREPALDVLVSHQLARADGLLAGDRRSDGGDESFRAAFSPAAAAREQPDPRPHAPAVHD